MNTRSVIKYSLLVCSGALIVLAISVFFHKSSLSHKQTVMNDKSSAENDVKTSLKPEEVANLKAEELINLLSSRAVELDMPLIGKGEGDKVIIYLAEPSKEHIDRIKKFADSPLMEFRKLDERPKFN